MTQVEYRDIAGWPGYRIGDDGNVFSMKLKRPLALKPEKNGYIRVDLYNQGIKEKFLVHRLVLEAFVGPCPPGMETRHLNGKRSQNNKGNLEWGTKSENGFDRLRHGTHVFTRGEKSGTAKLTARKVKSIRARRKRGEKYQAIADHFNISIVQAYRIANNQSWAHL